MSSDISPNEAGTLLADIETARAAMRRAIRDHRGHYHLWIWGVAWIAMPLTAHFLGDNAARFFPWICLGFGALSSFAGFTQNRQVRYPGIGRFWLMMLACWFFAVAFILVLRPPLDSRSLYAFACLVSMQTFVIGGVWMDNYLLWLGIIVTALILAGLFLFPGIFWIWMAVCGGGSLLLAGFYVRHFWN